MILTRKIQIIPVGDKEEIKRAQFENITLKSRIAVSLVKKQKIRLAFYFLYLCKELKHIRKGDKK